MEVLRDRIDHLIASRNLPWSREGPRISVTLWRSGRTQQVRFDKQGGFYVFWSVVVGSDWVTRNDETWRKLAYRAWRKNALKDLVTFAFDDKDRLIGLIEQPAATLDHEELQLYVETLARECDRFEYQLTGEDRAW